MLNHQKQGVVLFCLFSTISTAFEHQYRITKKSIDIHGSVCNITPANTPERLALLQLNYNESARQQQQRQVQHRSRNQQDDEQHLPLQHNVALPTSTTPYIDFEGSGQAIADERTEHSRWQAEAIFATTGAVVNKRGNLDSGSSSSGNNREEEGDGNGEDESNVLQLKPDVILRRLKRTVDLNLAAAPSILPSTSLTPSISLATPLPMAIAASTAAAVKPSDPQVKGE